MKVRAFKEEDLIKIKELHDKYFSGFDFPDFMQMLNSFIIEDDKGIILAGGLKLVAEIMLVTNMSRSVRTRVKALHEAKIASMFTCLKFEIDEAIAFTDNIDYKDQLIRNGFKDLGEGLSIQVNHG